MKNEEEEESTTCANDDSLDFLWISSLVLPSPVISFLWPPMMWSAFVRSPHARIFARSAMNSLSRSESRKKQLLAAGGVVVALGTLPSS